MEPPTANVTAHHFSRVAVLDVLRALALLGMIVVHFNDRSVGGGASGAIIQNAIDLLISGKSAAIFAILFGAGFAIFLRNAGARGEPVNTRFLRRMVGLFAFGFLAEGVFGYNVLIGYAVWGCALLVVRRWRIRSLVGLTVLCAVLSVPVFNALVGGYQWATAGADAANEMQRGRVATAREINRTLQQGTASTDFPTVVKTRVRHMAWFYQQPAAFLPHRLVTFLIGLIALRIGVWDRPREHRRVILVAMLIGILAVAVNTWLLPLPWPSLSVARAQGAIRSGLGLVPEWWLAFTYIGVGLLMVGSAAKQSRAIAAAGQMALTNYLVQVIVIDVVTRPYGLGLALTPQLALASALVLFGLQVVLSRVWLTNLRYGPAEWVLRCITNWRWEGVRRITIPELTSSPNDR